MPQGTDTSAVETTRRNVAPFGHNAALDTLIAASQELAKDETHRTAVVLVSPFLVLSHRVEAGRRSKAGED